MLRAAWEQVIADLGLSPPQAGLVASSPDPGHRQRRALRPTARGAALAGELARRAAGHQRWLADLIGPAEVTRLLGLLDHLESAVAAGLQAGPPGGEAQGQLPEKRESR